MQDEHLTLLPCDKYFLDGATPVILPNSSFNLWINDSSVFFENLFSTEVFNRQNGINQLQNLTPRIERAMKDRVYFELPVCRHSRLLHATQVACLLYAITKKAGFNQNARKFFSAIGAYHDAATPAGGDAVMRINREKLSEEINFSRVLKTNGLESDLKALGFDLEFAQACVDGKGNWGHMLDIVDKISYVSLDVYYLCSNVPKSIRVILRKNPLIIDVWQDINIGKQGIYFSNPERLYAFLFLRALLHHEFYYHPDCRKMEHIIFKEIKRLYDKSIINDEELVTHDDAWLMKKVYEHAPGIKPEMTPDVVGWGKFASEQLCDEFIAKTNKQVIIKEFIKQFKTGLDWKVCHNGELAALQDVITKRSAEHLRQLSRCTSGWFVYYYK
jgi:hypothetical protein